MSMIRHNLSENDSSTLSLLNRISTSQFSVFQARLSEPSKTLAIKFFPHYESKPHPAYLREVQATHFEHPNVMRVVYHEPAILTESRVGAKEFSSYVIMDYMTNGDLGDMIIQGKVPRDDKLIRTLFRNIYEGISYLHKFKFAHMDLKLDNILLDENFMPKITDFDSLFNVRKLKKGQIISRYGTVNYRAPELVSKSCNDAFAADIYSLGVILLILQLGMLPYNEEFPSKELDFQTMLIESNPRFFRTHMGRMRLPSEGLKSFQELVFGMLKKDPKERLTLEDIRKNEWFCGETYSKQEFSEMMKSCM